MIGNETRRGRWWGGWIRLCGGTDAPARASPPAQCAPHSCPSRPSSVVVVIGNRGQLSFIYVSGCWRGADSTPLIVAETFFPFFLFFVRFSVAEKLVFLTNYFVFIIFCWDEIEEKEVTLGNLGGLAWRDLWEDSDRNGYWGYVETLDEGVIRGTHPLLWKCPRPSLSSLTLAFAATTLTIPYFNKPQDSTSSLFSRKSWEERKQTRRICLLNSYVLSV